MGLIILTLPQICELSAFLHRANNARRTTVIQE